MSFEDAYNNPLRETDDLLKELAEKEAEIGRLKEEIRTLRNLILDFSYILRPVWVNPALRERTREALK